MTHNIVKRTPKEYYCTKCGQEWTRPSKAHCPNLKVFKFNEFGTLMTKTQLGQAGYKNTPQALPAPAGCYRRTMDGRDNEYVKLYDPALCEKKPPSKRPRKQTGLLSKVLVPLSLIPLIDDYRETSQIRETTKNFNSDIFAHWTQSAIDLANAVQDAQRLDDEALSRANAITLFITPFRFMGDVFEPRNPSYAHLISRRLVSAYQRYADAQKADA